MGRKSADNQYGPFKKGVDFLLHFRGRIFSLYDVCERYHCTYRQALRMKLYAEQFIKFIPSGFDERTEGRRSAFLWKLEF